MKPVGLFSRLCEQHHMVLEGPGQQGLRRQHNWFTKPTHANDLPKWHYDNSTVRFFFSNSLWYVSVWWRLRSLATLNVWFTCNYGLSVSLSIGSDSDKLLTQKWSYVGVTVYKDLDWFLQRHCCKVLHLKTGSCDQGQTQITEATFAHPLRCAQYGHCSRSI